MPDQPTPTVARLTVFPVKGLRGVDVPEARVTPFGLEQDRRYMLVGPEGRFLSQRSHPAMTRFSVEPESDTWRIHHPDAGSLPVPRAGVPEGEAVDVEIWGDRVTARHAGAQAARYFSEALEDDVRLVWMPEDADRAADPEFAGQGERVSFADGFPVLVLGMASIAELNTRLAEPVPLDRFRANVLLEGSGAWEEDGWARLQTDDVTLDLVKPCARCVVITTDQETGVRSKEPTATLATYRKHDGKVLVGMNALASPVGGVIHQGDILTAELR